MEKKVYLDTARSFHSQCFICGGKNEKLYVAPKKSIAVAYFKYKILIKHHARCCGRHLNEKKEIREEDIILIRLWLTFKVLTCDNVF